MRAPLGATQTRMTEHQECVRTGTWLYDETVPCTVRICQRTLRPGSGDADDPAEIREDQLGRWFEIEYFSPTEPARVLAGGGYFADLEAAVAAVNVATHGTVRWEDS
jgi:hypothetical protein